MKIAVIQSNPLNGDLRGNMLALERQVLRAAELGADLCAAPELSLSGPDVGDLFLQPSFLRACRQTLEEAAARLDASGAALPPLLLGAPMAGTPAGDGKVTNAAVLLHQGKATLIGGCRYSGSGSALCARGPFAPAADKGALLCRGRRLTVLVGTDIFAPDSLSEAKQHPGGFASPSAAKTGSKSPPAGAPLPREERVDGILALAALPFAQGQPERDRRILAEIARANDLPLIFVNMAGGHDSLVRYGASLGLDRGGNPTVLGADFAEDLLIVHLEAAGEKTSPVPSGMADQSDEPDEQNAMEGLWRAIVQGTRDYAAKNGFSSAVVGLSGGVDSSLVAAVAAESFGPGKVTGLLMPSPYSSSGSVDDARLVAENLGIHAHVLPVTPPLQAYAAVFDKEFPGNFTGLAEENIQARIRCAYVFAFANRFGALALATGNKSEAAVGYATLYGDLTGGLAPIGDIYKHQVYALCRLYNAKHPGAIPASVLTKAPSAELKPGQKDSDSLPPYETLDPLLFDIIENSCCLEQLVEKGHDRTTAQEVLRLVFRAEFKRRQGPPSLRLSSRGFAGGWRYPLTLGEWEA